MDCLQAMEKSDDVVYENVDLIYANATALREFHNNNMNQQAWAYLKCTFWNQPSHLKSILLHSSIQTFKDPIKVKLVYPKKTFSCHGKNICGLFIKNTVV